MHSEFRMALAALPRQVWVGVVVFVFLLLRNTVDAVSTDWPGGLSLAVQLGWAIPSGAIAAGVLEALVSSLGSGAQAALRDFGRGVRRFWLCFVGMNLIVTVVALAAGIILAAASAGPDGPRPVSPLKVQVVLVPLVMLRLFWQVALLSDDGRFWSSLGRGLRALGSSRGAFGCAVAYGLYLFADAALAEATRARPDGGRLLVALAAPRAAVGAGAVLVTGLWALALYTRVRIEVFGESAAPPPTAEALPAGERLLRAAGWLALLSPLPGVNLAALVVGLSARRRSGRSSLRALSASVLGAFSLLVYALVAVGHLLPCAVAEGTAAPGSAWQAPRGVSVVWSVVVLIILFVLHEYAHAYSAWRLGDDTAQRQGRLTLHPLAHLDWFGSVLLPGLLLWRDAGVVFGWAKPVPVNPGNFANPRQDNMKVSFAGPAMNLLIAMGCFLLLLILAVGVRATHPQAHSAGLAHPMSPIKCAGVDDLAWLAPTVAFLKQLLYTSVVLGCFNLLPVPPLDGSWILSGLLPAWAQPHYEKLRRYSLVFVLILVLTPAFDYVLMIPVGLVWLLLHLGLGDMGFG